MRCAHGRHGGSGNDSDHLVPAAHEMRTPVAIVGAGPAGLLLSLLLAANGIDSVLIETRSREYVEARIRAGVLEQSSVDLLEEANLADRLRREGDRHRGIYLQWPDERHHLDFVDLIGRGVWIYGQTELTRDLGHSHDAQRPTGLLRRERGRGP